MPVKIATLQRGPWAASTLVVVHEGDKCRECRQRAPQAVWNGYLPVCLPCAEEITREIEEKARGQDLPD